MSTATETTTPTKKTRERKGKTFGRALRAARRARGMTQGELSEALRKAKHYISLRQVSRLEKDEAPSPRVDQLEAIARVLRVPLRTLIP